MMAIGIGRDVDKRFRADAVARRERLGSEDLYFGAASRVPCLLSELLLVIHAHAHVAHVHVHLACFRVVGKPLQVLGDTQRHTANRKRADGNARSCAITSNNALI